MVTLLTDECTTVEHVNMKGHYFNDSEAIGKCKVCTVSGKRIGEECIESFTNFRILLLQ